MGQHGSWVGGWEGWGGGFLKGMHTIWRFEEGQVWGVTGIRGFPGARGETH